MSRLTRRGRVLNARTRFRPFNWYTSMKFFLVLVITATLGIVTEQAFGGTGTSSTRRVPTFTLDQAILTVLQRNPDLLRAEQEIKRTKGVAIEIRAQALPHITGATQKTTGTTQTASSSELSDISYSISVLGKQRCASLKRAWTLARELNWMCSMPKSSYSRRNRRAYKRSSVTILRWQSSTASRVPRAPTTKYSPISRRMRRDPRPMIPAVAWIPEENARQYLNDALRICQAYSEIPDLHQA
jgi:hypothetical protein